MIIPIRQQMDELDRKISDMEHSISYIAQYVKHELESSEKPKSIEELQQLNSKINDIESSYKEIAVFVRSELDSVRKDIREHDMKQLLEIKKIGGSSDASRHHEMERKLTDEITRMEEIIESSNRNISQEIESRINKEIESLQHSMLASGKVNQGGMEEYVQRIGKAKASLERYVNVKVQLLENRIGELTEAVKEIKSSPPSYLDEKIDDIDRRLSSDVEDLKKFLEAAVPGARNVPREKAGFEAWELERMQKEIESVKDEVSHLANQDISHEKAKFEEELKKISSEMREKAAHAAPVHSSKEIAQIRAELDEIRASMDSDSATRLSQTKNMQDIEHAVRNYNVKDEIEALKASIEKESVNRQSIEKNLSDMEDNISKLKDKFGPIAKMGDLDFEALKKEVGEFRDFLKNSEKDMHLKAMDLITKQLHEFAKSLDSKVPDLVTKDEFEERLSGIKLKLQDVVAPDMRPLARRIEQLELELGNISNMMHAMYNRVPIVVE